MNSIFYHVWIPKSEQLFYNFIEDQISRIKNTGLMESSGLNIIISGDMDQELIKKIKRLVDVDIKIQFYPEENQKYFEGLTLQKLYDHCAKNPEGNVLYMHTKGISYLNNRSKSDKQKKVVNSWKELLEWGCIDLWRLQVEKLKEYDVAGVNYSLWPWPHMSGNFWWARNDYIAKLPHPTDAEYTYDFRDIGDEKRLRYEKWIGLGHPRVYSHFSAPTCYHSYIPVSENTIKEEGGPDWFWLYRDDIAPYMEPYLSQESVKQEDPTMVSVIVLGSDPEKLDATLSSLKTQTCYFFECIFPDAVKTHDDLRNNTVFPIIRQKNKAALLNEVIENHTRADAIIIVDAGVVLSPDFLSETMLEIKLNKDCGIAFGFTDKLIAGKNKLTFNGIDVLAKNIVSSPVMFRKEDWAYLGGFDEFLDENLIFWDFWIRVCENKKLVQNPYCVATGNFEYKYTFDDHVVIYKKHVFSKVGITPTALIAENNKLREDCEGVNERLSNSDKYYPVNWYVRALGKKLKRRLSRLVSFAFKS